MQRLFSMFPNGRPGVALVLLRLGSAILLVDGVGRRLVESQLSWLAVAAGALALALCIGALTPVAASLSAVLELVLLITPGAPVTAVYACGALNALALALLGPGAYSIDAHLYGRRRVVLTPDELDH